MSEFSEKLSYYITKSGYNVYQLAKEASLDRTTLQKTVKGQRLPSFEYIKDICRYIKISKMQEEELFRLYQIEKLGCEVVESWDEIHQILMDIQKLRKKAHSQNFLNIHFDQQSFADFSEKTVQTFFSETETVKAVMCMIEQEIMEENSPELYMDVSWATQYALGQLVQSVNSNEKTLVCHQLVNLRSAETSKDGSAENFRILHQVLPYAFVFHKEYDIRYAYVMGDIEDYRYYLWPHYIVTHQHVFLCSEDKDYAILLSSEQIAKGYRKKLERMIHAYRPLFTFQGFSGKGIRMYRSIPENNETHMTYEDFPCLLLMFPESMQERLKKDSKIGSYAASYFAVPKTDYSSFINIFGMQGMKCFIQTGHLPGIFDNYFQVECVEERRTMVENFHQHLLAHSRRFYMINEEKFGVRGGFGIELFGKNKVVFYSTSMEFPFGFITIDEPGICEVFSSYFANLLDSEYLYSVEETIARYEKMVEEYFGEMESKQE